VSFRIVSLELKQKYEEDRLSVHIDNYAAQTGASLFLHEHAPPHGFLDSPHVPMSVIYNKTENLVWPDDFQHFDWIITEHAARSSQHGHQDLQWTIEGSIGGLRGFELKPMGDSGVWAKIKTVRIVQEPKLWLLRQRHD